jgi:hypothetical protein
MEFNFRLPTYRHWFFSAIFFIFGNSFKLNSEKKVSLFLLMGTRCPPGAGSPPQYRYFYVYTDSWSWSCLSWSVMWNIMLSRECWRVTFLFVCAKCVFYSYISDYHRLFGPPSPVWCHCQLFQPMAAPRYSFLYIYY